MRKPVHIAFHFPHGFFARMILRAGVAKKLTQQGARVSVISANADEKYFQQECQAEDATLWQEPECAGRIAQWFRMYRPYFLDDVMSNNALRAMHHRRFERRPITKTTLELVNRNLGRRGGTRELFKLFELAVNKSRKVKDLLKLINPDVLVLSTPFGPAESLYLRHAKELGIPVVCQMMSWDNITSKGTPLLMPDYFISWGPVMTDEMVRLYGFPRDRIYECGVPHFDVYQQKEQLTPRAVLLQQLNLPADEPYLFYGMVTGIHCPNEIEILAWLKEQINKNAFIRPCSLVIRPHPQTISGDYASDRKSLDRLKALAGAKVAVDFPAVQSERLAWDLPKGDMYWLASLLNNSAICLNSSSTLCLDACMLGRPVINLGFDGGESLPYEKSARRVLDYIHMAKLLSFGGIRVARSFNDLATHINTYLENPNLDRENRTLTANQECGGRGGRAAERIAETLLRLAPQGDQTHSPVLRSSVVAG